VTAERRQARTLAASKGLNFVLRHPTCLLTTQYGHHRAIANQPLIVPERIQQVPRSSHIQTRNSGSSKECASSGNLRSPAHSINHQCCTTTTQQTSLRISLTASQHRRHHLSSAKATRLSLESIAVMSNTITVCDPLVQPRLAHRRRRPCERPVLTCLQGEIYEKIIQEVINASQNDFEENGVQQQTLMELQQVGLVFFSFCTLPVFISWSQTTHLVLFDFCLVVLPAHLFICFCSTGLLPAKLKRRRQRSGGSGA
jgi:hypothetical protein